MAISRFYEKIKDAKIERTVEDVYNEGINLYFPTDKGIEYPFACDGFVDTKTDAGKVLKLIIEYKFNEVLTNKVARAKILAQVVFYLKRFEDEGMVLPNVCMVGDKDECFVLHTNGLLKHLDDGGIDWSSAPSNAAERNPKLVMSIANDEDINPFVFIVDDKFSFKEVADKIKDLADNVKRYVRVTEHNLSKIFDYFCKTVLKGGGKMDAHDLVEVFMGVIGDKGSYYLHPTKANTLVCKGREVRIDGSAFKAFFGYFDRNYTPQETMRIKGIADRLIADADRRMKGDFWTPTIWVDKAHELIEEQLGTDWKERYVVWDNCWGTGNLTRDYKFGELYCSTLYQSELNIGAEYNPEATKFQFDFLNDEIAGKNSLLGAYNDKLPKGLKDALLENKPIVFFLNPPYATASNMGVNKNNHKAGINNTMVRQQMIDAKLGSGAENLQHQFMYRIIQIKNEFNLTNAHIALFSKPIYLTGGKQANFLNVFCDNFRMIDGVLFNASNFSDVSDKWGITFNIWKNGISDDKNNFIHTLIERKDGEIVEIGIKNLYNLNGQETASKWVKDENIKNIIEFPNLRSAILLNDTGANKISENTIATFVSDSNNVAKNAQSVALLTGCAKMGHLATYSITDNNFDKCITLFSARKLIVGNWINDKDEYLAPNTNHEKWNEFVNDSIVYSLFHSSSNQSSLRNIEYKGKKWDIKNEFFWMSKDEITDLANENNFSFTFNDARTSSERYVHSKLKGIALSPEAQAVLDKATELVRKSFPYREMFDSEHPEYQIMNWDCGFYQLKTLWKEYFKDDFEEFKSLYKKLSDKMRPMVYALGFLK